jgi:plasmid stability protein
MATLYVENVPEELYESLRERARSNRRSISAETIFLLERMLPTAAELRRRGAVYRRIQRLSTRPGAVTSGPSTDQLLRGDRDR